MIVDANAYIGRWPFAPLGYESAEDVLRLMDRAGIDQAVLTSLNSVFYWDAEIGNREVGAAALAHPDRFIPSCVININLLGWREHLAECAERYGIRAIKLHPDYHKFSLLPDVVIGDEIEKLMEEARSRSLPVHIQTSLIDLRHHPGYCFVPEVSIPDVVQALRRYKENRFVIGGGLWFMTRAQDLINQATPFGIENFWIATDGLQGPFDGVTGLVKQIGAERFVFGSRTPILYSEASKDVVEQSDLSAEEKQAIFSRNAAGLLGLSAESASPSPGQPRK
jgi:predicted TIM-barrel fold metal-dependent hydrolase